MTGVNEVHRGPGGFAGAGAERRAGDVRQSGAGGRGDSLRRAIFLRQGTDMHERSFVAGPRVSGALLRTDVLSLLILAAVTACDSTSQPPALLSTVPGARDGGAVSGQALFIAEHAARAGSRDRQARPGVCGLRELRCFSACSSSL